MVSACSQFLKIVLHKKGPVKVNTTSHTTLKHQHEQKEMTHKKDGIALVTEINRSLLQNYDRDMLNNQNCNMTHFEIHKADLDAPPKKNKQTNKQIL